VKPAPRRPRTPGSRRNSFSAPAFAAAHGSLPFFSRRAVGRKSRALRWCERIPPLAAMLTSCWFAGASMVASAQLSPGHAGAARDLTTLYKSSLHDVQASLRCISRMRRCVAAAHRLSRRDNA